MPPSPFYRGAHGGSERGVTRWGGALCGLGPDGSQGPRRARPFALFHGKKRALRKPEGVGALVPAAVPREGACAKTHRAPPRTSVSAESGTAAGKRWVPSKCLSFRESTDPALPRREDTTRVTGVGWGGLLSRGWRRRERGGAVCLQAGTLGQGQTCLGGRLSGATAWPGRRAPREPGFRAPALGPAV